MKQVTYTLILFLLSLHFSSLSQPSIIERQGGTPLSKLLRHDGTIDTRTGFSGSVDPKGWRMKYGPRGEPRFVSVVPEDSLWDDRFHLPDLNSSVKGMAINGSDVFAVGDFTGAGGVRTNGVAKWDGSNWIGLGSGVLAPPGSAYAVAAGGGNVFVGGYFTSISGVSANCIAKWNGSSWSALGSGTNSVTAIAVSGSNVYVGCYGTPGMPSVYIAKWNGTSWDSLGSGVNNSVAAIAISGNDVYVGGYFTSAGGHNANRIAKWNGVSWDSLASGLDGPVLAIALSGSDLYAGGQFGYAGGANGIAKWNGSTWSSLGSGVGASGYVSSITVSGSAIYAGGRFSTAGGTSATNVARWNGSTWASLDNGLGVTSGSDGVFALAVVGTNIYAGGTFAAPVGGSEAHNVARWDGSAWSPLHSTGIHLGMNSYVRAVAVRGTEVYVGGGFTQAGGVSANRIAKWDGSVWAPLGVGISGEVNAIAVNGNDVYAGGFFTTAGGVSANSIAKWNGTNWSALGSGLNNRVNAIAISGSSIYAGGYFTTAGGTSASRVAKWDGSNWSALGTGIDGFGIVYALAISGTDLYVGGSFTSIGGVSTYNIGKWNGSSWSALGGGIPFASGLGVTAIAISGNTVYACGDFILPGNLNQIARWNGTNWSAVGNGIISALNNPIYAIALRANEIFVGGYFAGPGGPYLAKWNGSAWSGLGSNVGYGGVLALGFNGGNLYVGGDFSLAGDKPANRISRWFGSPIVTFQPPSGGVGSAVTITGGEFDPNPMNNTVRFGSVPAIVTSANLGSLTTTVPVGASTSFISVTTRNLTGTSSSQFVVVVPPAQVNLVAPPDNAAIGADSVRFIWRQGGSGVTAYWLERATDSLFANSLIDSTITDTTSIVRSFQNNQRYWWKVRAKNISGWGIFSEVRRLNITFTGVSEDPSVPIEFALHQNYPNPFNPSTTISYDIPTDGRVSLRVYNYLGQEVATLVDEVRTAGRYQTRWDASGVASGVYFYKIASGEYSQIRRMLLIK